MMSLVSFDLGLLLPSLFGGCSTPGDCQHLGQASPEN